MPSESPPEHSQDGPSASASPDSGHNSPPDPTGAEENRDIKDGAPKAPITEPGGADDPPPPDAKADAADQAPPAPKSGAGEPGWLELWSLPLNAFLMLAAGISLYFASSQSPAVGGLALAVGILAALPFAYSILSPNNGFRPHLDRINKVALLLLAALPIWQLNHYLLEGTEIPIVQHLVSLSLVLALCCLVVAIDRRRRDFSNQALSAHLALRAIDSSSWIYAICIGIVLALATCALVRVLAPGSIIDIKLLSRGIIPPLTLMLFYAGLSDLVTRYWMVFSQSRDKVSALNLLLPRLRLDKREETLETIYTCIDRSGEFNRYLLWAIPILGFIGTVLGISLAAQGMGSMLTSASQEYSEVLTEALEPLGIAFDTTLIALSLSLVLALAQSVHGTWIDRLIGRLVEIHSGSAEPQEG